MLDDILEENFKIIFEEMETLILKMSFFFFFYFTIVSHPIFS